MSPRADITTPNPDFDNITAADLRDTDRMKALYVEAVRRRFWANTPQGALDFFALGDKALQDDDQGTPGKLFYSLVKAKRTERITNAQEAQAMRRMPSVDREELVRRAKAGSDYARRRWKPIPKESAVRPQSNAGPLDLGAMENLGFSHSILMQCFLPQRRQEGREHTQNHGRVSLIVRAGWRMDPGTPGAFTPGAIPWGSRARLVMHYITSEAIRTQSPEIDMGRSLHRFLQRIGVPVGGQNAKTIIEQVQDVAGADIILGGWERQRAVQHRATVAHTVSFWLEQEGDERQQSFWRPSMTLSQEFFDAINQHPVPLDSRHVAQLGRSARRIDLYCWLTYRTAQIGKGEVVAIPLDQLRPIFAPDLAPQNARRFRSWLRRDLAAICALHPFAVELRGKLLELRRSPPPIPVRASVILGPQPAKSDPAGL